MKFGYIRVSTREQSTARQEDQLRAVDCEKIFIDIMSGKKKERPQLQRMFEQFRAGDTLVVTELARFGRSFQDLLELMTKLEKLGVDFVSLREQFETITPTGRLLFRVAAALSEFEREIIVMRTNEGLQAARARGKNGGRPRIPADKLDTINRMYDCGRFTVDEISRACGISKSTIYRYQIGREHPIDTSPLILDEDEETF